MAGHNGGPSREWAGWWEFNLRSSNSDVLVQVRRWMAAELSDLGDAHINDVTLVAIELLTNAYEHGGGPRAIRLSRSREPCRVDVQVEDNNADQLTLGVSRFGPGANRGRGLILVDKLAESWGVQHHDTDGGKSVWARVSCENNPCPQ